MLDKGLNNVVEKNQLSKFKIEGKIVHQIFFKEKNWAKNLIIVINEMLDKFNSIHTYEIS